MNFLAVALRTRTTRAHIWLTYAVSLLLACYIFTTWAHPHRLLLLGLVGAYVATGAIVSMVPAELLLMGGRRDVALLLWSFAELSLIAGMSALDGGVASPLTVILFVPLLISALSAPLLAVLAVGVMEVIAYVGLALDLGGAADPRIMTFTFALGLAALAGAWLAHIFDAQQRELIRTSRTDPLTGALNRRGFSERLEGALDDARRTGHNLALVLLDLNRFKQVNDVHGHAVGDELLGWTVSTLREVVRPMDSIGRLGGDEFAILLPRCARDDALAVVARLHETLSGRAPASIGLSCFPADGEDVESLLHRADEELYAAKRLDRHLHGLRSQEFGWASMIARAVDLRMAGQNAHSNAVARTAEGIGRELELGSSELLRLRIAGMLHDIGNVLLPDHILLKHEALTKEERSEVERSRVTAAELLAEVDGVTDVADWIRHCDEHFDGSGYPDGLRGEDIPLVSRILHVADAYEGLTSGQPDRPAMPSHVALGEIEHDIARRFDPGCVAALRRYLEQAPTIDTDGEATEHFPSAGSVYSISSRSSGS